MVLLNRTYVNTNRFVSFIVNPFMNLNIPVNNIYYIYIYNHGFTFSILVLFLVFYLVLGSIWF